MTARDSINAAIRAELTKRGYKIPDMAYTIISDCDDWYRARETDAHRRKTVSGVDYTLERMGFGRRVAADDANLCEVIEVNPGEGAYDFVQDILRRNRFNTQYRKQLELTAAEGTVAAYVRLEGADVYSDGSLRGGDIRINYVEAGCFCPLTVEDDVVTEAAFWGYDYRMTRHVTEMVICTKDDNGLYHYIVRAYDEAGNRIPERDDDVTLGEVRPFAVMHTAQVNTFDGMQGFGFPKLAMVIPVLQGLDSAFTALLGDIDQSEKITLINELLCKFDDSGNPITPGEQMKRRFVMLGEKLPDQQDLVHEITPAIRADEFKNTIELLLSVLSQQFGFGTKKYSFDSNTNSMVTATQYIGERQDMLQELNRQRHCAREYITDLVHALLWFGVKYQGHNFALDDEVLIDFDDSYIENKADRLESIRQDVINGIGGAYVRQQYLMQKYNLDEAEAAKWAANDDGLEPETED